MKPAGSIKVTQGLKSEFRQKLNVAFSVMTVIPFLTFFYVVNTELNFLSFFLGNTGLIIATALVLALCGYWFGLSMLQSALDEITRETQEIDLANAQVRKTQELLLQAEKFKAIGELASGIAHEVRNPLGIILADINYLEENPTDPARQAGILKMMKKNITRADNIINTLVDFSRVRQLNMVPVDINLVIENSLAMAAKKAQLKDIVIVKELEDLPVVLGDMIRLEQVVLNLVLNAIQAMPAGGEMVLRTFTRKARELDILPLAARSGYFPDPQESLVIAQIEDHGIGIPAEEMVKIFDPFFTTKGPREGVGLGLTVARNIMDMHRGFIHIDSQKSGGTKATLVLKTESSKYDT